MEPNIFVNVRWGRNDEKLTQPLLLNLKQEIENCISFHMDQVHSRAIVPISYSAILTKRYDTYHIYIINKLQAMYHIYDKLKKEYFTYIMYTAGRENIYENIEKCKKSSSHSSPRCDFEIDFHVLEQDLAAR